MTTIDELLCDAGCSEADILDLSNVTGFFTMTNRIVFATDRIPNQEYRAIADGTPLQWFRCQGRTLQDDSTALVGRGRPGAGVLRELR